MIMIVTMIIKATTNFHCLTGQEVCQTPPEPNFGLITCNPEADGGKSCGVQCQPGYRFQSTPASQYTCAADGTWTPPKETIPDCVPSTSFCLLCPTVFQVRHFAYYAYCVPSTSFCLLCLLRSKYAILRTTPVCQTLLYTLRKLLLCK